MWQHRHSKLYFILCCLLHVVANVSIFFSLQGRLSRISSLLVTESVSHWQTNCMQTSRSRINFESATDSRSSFFDVEMLYYPQSNPLSWCTARRLSLRMNKGIISRDPLRLLAQQMHAWVDGKNECLPATGSHGFWELEGFFLEMFNRVLSLLIRNQFWKPYHIVLCFFRDIILCVRSEVVVGRGRHRCPPV